MVAGLLAPVYIGNIPSKAAVVHLLALVRIIDPMKGSTWDIPRRYIHVGKHINSQDLRTITTGALIKPWQGIPSGERQ